MHISWFLLQFHLSNFDKEIGIRLCYHDLAGGKEKRKKPIIRFFRPASGQSTKQFHILKLPGERRTFLRHLSRSSQGRAPTALLYQWLFASAGMVCFEGLFFLCPFSIIQRSVQTKEEKMMASWNREDLPYDAMGDFSTFEFEGTEEASCAQDNHAGEIKPAVIPQMLCTR